MMASCDSCWLVPWRPGEQADGVASEGPGRSASLAGLLRSGECGMNGCWGGAHTHDDFVPLVASLPGHQAGGAGTRDLVHVRVRVCVLAGERLVDGDGASGRWQSIDALALLPPSLCMLLSDLRWDVTRREVIGDFPKEAAREFAQDWLNRLRQARGQAAVPMTETEWATLYDVCGGNALQLRNAVVEWDLAMDREGGGCAVHRDAGDG